MFNNEQLEKMKSDYRAHTKSAPSGFCMISPSIIYYLDKIELKVFLHICCAMNRYGHCNDTVDKIAECLDYGFDHINRVLTKLQDMELITFRKTFHQISRFVNLDNYTLLNNYITRCNNDGTSLRKIVGDKKITDITDNDIKATKRFINKKKGIAEKVRKRSGYDQVTEKMDLFD